MTVLYEWDGVGQHISLTTLPYGIELCVGSYGAIDCYEIGRAMMTLAEARELRDHLTAALAG